MNCFANSERTFTLVRISVNAIARYSEKPTETVSSAEEDPRRRIRGGGCRAATGGHRLEVLRDDRTRARRILTRSDGRNVDNAEENGERRRDEERRSGTPSRDARPGMVLGDSGSALTTGKADARPRSHRTPSCLSFYPHSLVGREEPRTRTLHANVCIDMLSARFLPVSSTLPPDFLPS